MSSEDREDSSSPAARWAIFPVQDPVISFAISKIGSRTGVKPKEKAKSVSDRQISSTPRGLSEPWKSTITRHILSYVPENGQHRSLRLPISIVFNPAILQKRDVRTNTSPILARF